MLREAEFAYKQAFSFYPGSPEVIANYSKLLVDTGRIEDAIRISNTALAVDPNNLMVPDLLRQLQSFQQNYSQAMPSYEEAQATLGTARALYEEDPLNLTNTLQLISSYYQLGHTNEGSQVLISLLNYPDTDVQTMASLVETFTTLGDVEHQQQAISRMDKMLNDPDADALTILNLAQAFQQLQDLPRLVQSLLRLTELEPENPEAWYDLAAMQAASGQANPAIQSLKQALELNDERLRANPNADQLRDELAKDDRFLGLKELPTYKLEIE